VNGVNVLVLESNNHDLNAHKLRYAV